MPLVQFAERQRENREARDMYGVALGVLLLSTLGLVASGAAVSSPAVLIAALLQMVALGVTLRVSGFSRRRIVIGVSLALLIAALGVTAAATGGREGSLIALVGWLVLVIATIVGIVRRLRQYRRVTLPLVLGLLCVYLLLGLGFALSYGIANALIPHAFSPELSGLSDAVYLSFITLATVGYGDVAPASSLVRAIAVAEAILGQLYLVSIVSLAVSRLGNGRAPQPQPRPPGSEEEK